MIVENGGKCTDFDFLSLHRALQSETLCQCMCIVLAVKVLIVVSDLHTRKLQHIIESLSDI